MKLFSVQKTPLLNQLSIGCQEPHQTKLNLKLRNPIACILSVVILLIPREIYIRWKLTTFLHLRANETSVPLILLLHYLCYFLSPFQFGSTKTNLNSYKIAGLCSLVKPHG